ncbi:unnamed protein product [Rhizophagus irregularis]|nr:unnamed protein product [Rhizophagus irregularis]
MNIHMIHSGIKLKRVILLTLLNYKIRTCLAIKQEKRKIDTVYDDDFAIVIRYGATFYLLCYSYSNKPS